MDRELSFVQEVFRRRRVSLRVCEAGQIGRQVAECQEEGMRDERFMPGGSVYARLSSLRPGTLYRLKDSLHRCFICLLLPDDDGRGALIGPFLAEPISETTLLSLGEKLGVSSQKQRYLREYYRSLPVMGNEGTLATVLGTFCELVWQTPSYGVERIGEEVSVVAAEPAEGGSLTDLQVNVKALEMRYAFENELMRAVTLGQTQMEERLVGVIGSDAIEKRASSPLRNMKNYGIIMNTLLRKAAEQGGVHPLYIDRASSELARRIEEVATTEEGAEVMREMFRAYCMLVRRHSIQKYSSVVRQAVIAVDTDLSSDLSPSRLAEAVGVSPGYLSTVFRKETGSTLTEYVRSRRMELAEHLLSGTELQIQTVALHCGIMDVQYFTKLFKRRTGMTPSEYRSAHRHGTAKEASTAKNTPNGK